MSLFDLVDLHFRCQFQFFTEFCNLFRESLGLPCTDLLISLNYLIFLLSIPLGHWFLFDFFWPNYNHLDYFSGILFSLLLAEPVTIPLVIFGGAMLSEHVMFLVIGLIMHSFGRSVHSVGV